jgi:hypothetical protein
LPEIWDPFVSPNAPSACSPYDRRNAFAFTLTDLYAVSSFSNIKGQPSDHNRAIAGFFRFFTPTTGSRKVRSKSSLVDVATGDVTGEATRLPLAELQANSAGTNGIPAAGSHNAVVIRRPRQTRNVFVGATGIRPQAEAKKPI